jgi:hypothetical protein
MADRQCDYRRQHRRRKIEIRTLLLYSIGRWKLGLHLGNTVVITATGAEDWQRAHDLAVSAGS